MPAAKRYPANECLPQGWYSIVKGDEPMMWLEAYDGSIVFDLMGGLSQADLYAAPESVQIPRDGLTGLIPPWRHIDQKGATQDGVTQVDALYEPIEVGLKGVCRGRDGRHTRQVHRDLIASIDAKQESTLAFLDRDLGHWWAPVRWFKGAPQDPIIGAQQKRQPISLRLRADSAFWRSYANTDSFGFIYDSMTDTFTEDYSATQDLGPGWTQYYIGDGDGYCSTTTAASGHEQMRWYESGNEAREVVNIKVDFDTDTNNQVVEMVLGTFPEFTLPGGAFNDLWARANHDEDYNWLGDGVRARVGLSGILGWVELTWWVDFTMVHRWYRPMIIPPLMGEKFTLICGDQSDTRMVKVLRNGVPILQHKETGANLSLIDADHRGVGSGMRAGAGILSQASPAWVRKVSAGDNAAVSQSGFLERVNIGDQKMYDDYQFYGPGTVRIYDGPGSQEYVEFGPLAANQAALLRTDPRDRNVYDFASIPATPTEQEKNIFDAAFNGLLSFLTLTNTNPLLQLVQSIFGIFGARQAPALPQGNMYALLKGRFSDRSAIPAKSPGNPAQKYHVKVEIRDGNADSKLVVSGIPLRRSPL